MARCLMALNAIAALLAIKPFVSPLIVSTAVDRNRRKRFSLRLNLITGLLNYELAHPSWFIQKV